MFRCWLRPLWNQTLRGKQLVDLLTSYVGRRAQVTSLSMHSLYMQVETRCKWVVYFHVSESGIG
jgi:hypothetical protein